MLAKQPLPMELRNDAARSQKATSDGWRTNVHKDQESTSVSLTSKVYALLRSDILTGNLKAGQRLRIDELRQQHNASASAIREALTLLKSDLLVDRVDQRGFSVAPMSPSAFEELLNTRCWLEERALRESIRNGDRAWEEAIVVAAYHASHTPGSTAFEPLVTNDAWETHHKAFHQALLAPCQSDLLNHFCDQMYDLNIRYRRLASAGSSPERDIRTEHTMIMDATLARDADRAVALLIDHYRKTGNDFAPSTFE
jgi:GntR family carbon starvation induced transcriptional regulator